MKKLLFPFFAVFLFVPVSQALASNSFEIQVEITNLSHANYLTPILVATHPRTLDMFELAEPASDELRAIAEGGDVAPMQAALLGGGASVSVAETSSGAPVLGPGETATAIVEVDRTNRKLSLAAMILPTNDGFVGLDSINVRKVKKRTVFLRSYDAGTEGNDEILNPGAGGVVGTPGIPGDPSGLSGTGGSGVSNADFNDTVHIHRGILGDDDPSGGSSDLDRSAHRWSDPIARVVIRRIY